MSSQKKVIQFIKEHYAGDMNRALSVLADAIKVKKPTSRPHKRPNKEKDLESFWYNIIYALCNVEKRFLGTSDKVVRVKLSGIRKALNVIRPMVNNVNKKYGLDVLPSPDKYNEWKKTAPIDLDESSIAGTIFYSKNNITFFLFLYAVENENGKYENEILFQTSG